MKKYFKSHRRKNNSFFSFLLLSIVSIFISSLLISNLKSEYVLSNKAYKVFDIDLDKDKILLSLGLNMHEKTKDIKIKPVFSEKRSDYLYQNPTIYIYNTHQTEEYKNGNIYEASLYLKDKLSKDDFNVYVEDTKISEEVAKNNLSYKDSYKVTRKLLTKHINDDTVLYIDLHRDSSSYETSTIKENDKSYARIMFVVGGKHETFNDNYLTSEKLNKLLKNINNKISRGIYVRKSSSYNQDLNSNIILIEVGGPHNSIEEVKNSLDILALAILEYVGE